MKTTEQAKLEKVSGYDVFQGDHIFYISDINRSGGVAQLCRQAYFLATDAAVVRYRGNRNAEAEVWKRWIEAGGDIAKHEMPPSTYGLHMLEQRFLDFYKIGGALELALKAKLLSLGYVLHYISDTCDALRDRQKKEPISIEEFLNVSESFHDGKRNYFPGLTDKSLTFDNILKKAGYCKVIGLNESQARFFDEIRTRRNFMHLPAGEQVLDGSFIQGLGEGYMPFMLQVLNEFIVDLHNMHKVHGQPLVRLDR